MHYKQNPRPEAQFRNGGTHNHRTSIIQSRPIELVLDRLRDFDPKLKSTGPDKWLCRCPAHGDKSPSLSIKETDEGNVLFYCFAGCSFTSIIDALGFEASDLFPRDQTYRQSQKPRLRASEVMETVVSEAYILSCALRQLLNGTGLSESDYVRVKQAIERISGIHVEVNRGR